jgi:hypothetical protein
MNQLSTRVTTHEIHYDQGGKSMKVVRVTSAEAKAASEQWQIWRPVGIPNRVDNYKTVFLINPSMVVQIGRYKPT